MREPAETVTNAGAGGVKPTRTPGFRRSGGALLLLVISLLGVGCVQYVPVDLTSALPPPDEEVRVRFTDDAVLRLARDFGRIRYQVEGQVQPQAPDSLAISLWVGREYRDTPFADVRQTLVVGLGEVRDVARREVSVGRSVVAVVGAVTLFAALTAALSQVGDENSPPDDHQFPPPPDERRTPDVRIWYGWSR